MQRPSLSGTLWLLMAGRRLDGPSGKSMPHEKKGK
jgi:hypothetical protein